MEYQSVAQLQSLQPGEWTTGRTLGPALFITDQAEADAYFAALVGMLMDRWGKPAEECQTMSREAIAHLASIMDEEVIERVQRLFLDRPTTS